MTRTFELGCGTACLLLGIAAFSTPGSAIPPQAAASLQARRITNCQTISDPGPYRVAANLAATGDCLVVAVSHVQLDLGGFTITGDGTGSAVTISDPNLEFEGIDVRRGTVSNFQIGIDLGGAGLGVVNAVRAVDNVGDGIRIGPNSVVEGNISKRNGGTGIFAAGASTITRNTTSDNGSHGIHAGGGVVSECTARRNSGDGIHALGAGAVVRGNTVQANDGSGIVVVHGVARENAAIGNDLHGIDASCPSSVVGNTATLNGGLAIYTFGVGCALAINATD